MLEKIIDKVQSFNFSNIKLAIVYGGEFEESDVSRMSFLSIANTLKANDFAKIDTIEYSDRLIYDLEKANPDIVFNAMHGEFGEDGGLPAICNFLRIKHTHSGVFTSSLGMQKDLCKTIFKDAGIEIAKSITLEKKDLNEDFLHNIFNRLETDKFILKPNDGGSSIGISIIEKGEKMNIGVSLNCKSEKFLAEEFIEGNDFCVPVLLSRPLGILELSPKDGFYDYENKYTAGKTEHIFPARVPDEISEKMLKYAKIAHEIFGCKTISRSDFRFDKNTGKMSMSEINTHPGFTATSIYPEVALYNGINFETLLKIIIYDGYFG